ncbi:MAG TPA: hypothetical protein VLB76_29925 [Thermoanaerobaculia bacterium]|jgi:hypothetical protein|nr:hypothetical protein [Thermoanaerobaculia bacterium]
MSDRIELLDKDILRKILRLAGQMLVEEAFAVGRGETPMPLLALIDHDLDSPRFRWPLMDESEAYHDHVRAARAMIVMEKPQRWIFVYDHDLEYAGRILIIEMGMGEPACTITFGQRYVFSAEPDLRLVGRLELIGREFLPSSIRETLESSRWRALLIEGATQALASQQLPAWPSVDEPQSLLLTVDEFRFAPPEGWIFRQTQDGHGWVMARLVPWEHWGFEPVLIARMVECSGPTTPADNVEDSVKQLLDRGDEVLKAEVFASPSPELSVDVGHIVWRNREKEGALMGDFWVPTDSPRRFLLLSAISFNDASWNDLLEASEGVLASLDIVTPTPCQPS